MDKKETMFRKLTEQEEKEFRQWASKAKVFGEAQAYEEMLQAAQEMDKASESLSRALRRLEEKGL